MAEKGAISGSQINEEHCNQVAKDNKQSMKDTAVRLVKELYPHLKLDHTQWNDTKNE